MGDRRARTLRNVILLIAVVWFPLFELGSCVVVRILVARGFVYEQGVWDQGELDAYLKMRDPLVGWPGRPFRRGKRFDEVGARASPAYPDATVTPCVATFGDSFTFGTQVDDEDAYPNVLAKRLACRVNNYGWGGYGTDQALLTFRRINDDARVVVLGHYSHNILRNVNRYRNLMAGAAGFGFKPRFIVENGELELLPIPTPSSIDVLNEIVAHPQFLEHDYFFPNTQAGTLYAGFPKLLTVLRIPWNWRIQAKLRGQPTYAPFYQSDHPSGALEVTAAIIVSFHEEALKRNQMPVTILLPDELDLLEVRSGRALPYQPLIDKLHEEGVRGPQVANEMLDFLDGRDVCELFINCHEHYTPAGYELVAQIVEKWIRSRGYLRGEKGR